MFHPDIDIKINVTLHFFGPILDCEIVFERWVFPDVSAKNKILLR